MATLLGNIEQYQEGQEEWPQYVERLEQFLQANDIVGESKANKRRSVFLAVIGPGPYKLLRSLLAPEKPAEKTFDELVSVLTKHYSPPPSEIVQRFRFHTRVRKPGESVATFVAELRGLSEFCNFDNSLEKMLRDRLVCGINDPAIQKRLLAEPDLTFNKALALAQGLETAAKDVNELKGSQSSGTVPVKTEPVNSVQQNKPPKVWLRAIVAECKDT